MLSFSLSILKKSNPGFENCFRVHLLPGCSPPILAVSHQIAIHVELPKIDLRWTKTNFSFKAGNFGFASALLPIIMEHYGHPKESFSQQKLEKFFEGRQGELQLGQPHEPHLLIRFFELEKQEDGETVTGHFSRLETHNFGPPFADEPLFLEIECLERETGDTGSLTLESTDQVAYTAIRDCLKNLIQKG